MDATQFKYMLRHNRADAIRKLMQARVDEWMEEGGSNAVVRGLVDWSLFARIDFGNDDDLCQLAVNSNIIESQVFYRPVGVPFLDKTNPQAFWTTREKAESDFPKTVVKQYSEKEIIEYCDYHLVDPDNIELY